MAAKTPFVRFLSSVEGHLVSRYGSATAKTAPTLIGARRTHAELVDGLSGQASIEWTDEIVSLTELSRSRVLRILAASRRDGTVQIRVTHNLAKCVELERALEERQELKERLGPLKKEYEAATDSVKGLLGDMALEEEIVVRAGRFRIKRSIQEGATVSFERAPGTRVSISLLGE